MDAVCCYVDGQPKSYDKYLGPLAGALRSAVNRHTGYTPNRLMLGREVNIPATFIYAPSPSTSFKNREEGEVDRYLQDLDVQSAHDIAHQLPGQSVERDGDSSLVYNVATPLGTVDSGISPESPGVGSNPKGIMVQCDSCREWFHPERVGISEDYA
ncbi:uncharacterized protein LOC134241445, partial [Saccostrea cucullata]|uniref:uncharacterized protein LOC134241445 n=1 Tax=Saccostrea cuccullata TaxID=36930 RepID=UPI002ECFC120